MGVNRNAQQKQLETRQEEGQARNAKWQSLSPAQQLAVLDKRLGKGVGAARQRARIAARLNPKKAA
jgi:hypothetical protein